MKKTKKRFYTVVKCGLVESVSSISSPMRFLIDQSFAMWLPYLRMLFLEHLVVEWQLDSIMLLTGLILVHEPFKCPKLFSPKEGKEIVILLARKKAKIYPKKKKKLKKSKNTRYSKIHVLADAKEAIDEIKRTMTNISK